MSEDPSDWGNSPEDEPIDESSTDGGSSPGEAIDGDSPSEEATTTDGESSPDGDPTTDESPPIDDDAEDGGDSSRSGGVRERLPSASAVLLSVFAGIAGFVGSYAAVGRSSGYLLEPFASLLTTYAPSFLLRYLRNDFGSTLQKFTAIGLAVAALAAATYLALWAADRVDRPILGVPLAALATGGLTVLATGVLPAAGATGAAAGIVVLVGEVGAGWSRIPVVSPDRRRVLSGVAAAAGLAVAGRVIGNQRSAVEAVGRDPLAGRGSDDPTLTTVDQEEVDGLLSTAAANSFDLEDVEPLVSRDFYAVDINKVDPEVDPQEWSLSVTGEVESERTFDYGEIRSMEPEHRFVTLRCVSDGINGGAMDNALWTGVPAAKIMEGTNPDGEYVLLHGDDGYSVGFPLAAFQEGLLAYGMNGKVLPRAHGFPLRALVPGHWGETNTKWITEIEVTDELQDGYWEQRGWEGTGPVHTVAKLKAVERPGDGRIVVGGNAYAGTRGVSAVEVSIDGGDTWQRAEVSEQLPGEDVWRQWRFEYDSPGEKHEVVVRAIEADGTVQPEEKDDAYPGGAMGYVSKTVDP